MVDYWETDIAGNPQCPHGPTLLFSRKGNERKFYACSAFRDRKKCPFFLWQDETNSKKLYHDESFSELISTFRSRRNDVLELVRTRAKKMMYCCTCEMLILAKKCIHTHDQHNVKEISDDEMLRYPARVMRPKQQSKGESQFHFAESTINTMFDFLVQLNISAVMCVGCPTMHEFISNKQNCNMKSLLLDIDHRFLQFYEEDQFQLFNMYSCHMFDDGGWDQIRKLSSAGKICVIIDPPFGGRIEPLAYTLNYLQTMCNTDLTVLLILPYFMEPAVKLSLPLFSMLDYKVEYANHSQFKQRTGDTSNRGSPVRIFTNVNVSSFVLPREEGYKYCDTCERWVCQENEHCFKCEACTSKNGGAYRHCNRCGKCVKQTWKHCFKCGICKLAEHVCKEECLEQALQGQVKGNVRKRFLNLKRRDKKKKKFRTNS